MLLVRFLVRLLVRLWLEKKGVFAKCEVRIV